MGLFDKLFGAKSVSDAVNVKSQWQMLTGYTPVFYSWRGSLYESELVRSAIDARARHISKLSIQFVGSAKQKLARTCKNQPNSFQTWSQFLYRVSTILDVYSTCCIVPIFDRYGDIEGFFPILPTSCEIVNVTGKSEPYVRYSFANGKKAALELSKCGILTKYQLQDDIFGTNNEALRNTLSLIDMNNQGIKEGIKNSATFRFMAQVSNFTKMQDLKTNQQEFNDANFKGENGGILLFPNNFKDIKQITSQPFTVDDKQVALIRTNVYNYFGVNEKILQNACYGDEFSAFYEGVVEVFAIQLSDVLSKMVFTNQEMNTGNKIFATSNRLQYMSNSDKLNVSASMADRGLMSINEIREIWNLPPIENGDSFTLRGEYYLVDESGTVKTTKEGENDG